MKVLEDQITIVMGGRAPTRSTGATGGSSSSIGLGRQTFQACLLEQVADKLNRKAE